MDVSRSYFKAGCGLRRVSIWQEKGDAKIIEFYIASEPRVVLDATHVPPSGGVIFASHSANGEL